jgi:hypothetical protein
MMCYEINNKNNAADYYVLVSILHWAGKPS